MKGRKRVELCDMSGNLLDAIVVPANTDERACALCLLVKVKKAAWSRNLRTIFADNGFGGEEFELQIKEQLGYKLEIVRRDKEHQGFVVLPKRWLIEQVFGCQGRNRRLSRDYE
ncbi:MAG: IS5/IS1182 family transposase, partial [Oxalobacteraceae bacterium]